MNFTLNRAFIVCDRITGEQARALYERAGQHAESLLTGDLVSGFSFWTLSELEDKRWLRLTHCHVAPIGPAEEPSAHAARQRVGWLSRLPTSRGAEVAADRPAPDRRHPARSLVHRARW
jgi:hypothetical protein